MSHITLPRETVIDSGRYWTGIAATAAVAALVAVVAVLVFEKIAAVNLLSRPAVFSSDLANYVLLAVSLTALAGLIAYGLAKAAPRPGVFFGWIMALLLLVGLLWPFAWTRHVPVAVCTSVANVAVGAAVWSLSAITLRRTAHRVTRPTPNAAGQHDSPQPVQLPHQPQPPAAPPSARPYGG